MNVFRTISAIIINSLILLFCVNCSNTGYGLPSNSEQLAMENGELSLVLFRLHLEYVDGTREPVSTCDSGFLSRVGIFYIGFAKSPIIGGEVERRSITRFLSQDSCRNGWSFIFLGPGRHFITFQGPKTGWLNTWNRELRNLPRWQLDIDAGNLVVYIGTLHLTSSRENLWNSYLPSMTFVSNEEELAEQIIKENLGNSMPITTSLMERL